MTHPVSRRPKSATPWPLVIVYLIIGVVNIVLILVSAPSWMRILAIVIGLTVMTGMFIVVLRQRART